MRILHIIATLDRRAGGPSDSVRRVVASYPGIGSQGEVLTLDPPDATFLRDLAFPIHTLGPVSTRYGYNRRLIPWLRTERERFDGVVIHGLWQYIGYAVLHAVHPYKPYLVFSHGMLDPYFKHAFPLKHLKKCSYWLLNEYWVLSNARSVLFTSENEAANARASFWPSRWRSSVVPYGSSAPEGDPHLLRNGFLLQFPRLAHSDGTPRRFILFLGRIHAKKGCDLLLDAFLRIAERQPDLNLVFAGPDQIGIPGEEQSPFKEKLVARATAAGLAHRVHWTGMLYSDLKWGAFYACEAFCLPSHQENFGIAVAEALACGKPVLISDKVNIWEEIARDGAALVAPDTAAGTRKLLEEWIALDPERRHELGLLALACFQRRYDTRANASGIVEVFSQTLVSSKTSALAHTIPAKANLPAS